MPTTLFDADNQLERFLTFEELANLLKLPEQTLYDWLKTRRIPYYRIGWRTIRFRASEIEAFLNRSLIPATAPPVPVRRRRSKSISVESKEPVAKREEVAA
jgi:excisionase family DNA binding protein